MRIPLAFFVTLFIALATTADACNIPVFRYALERWQSDACEVLVFHDGTLSAAQQRLVEKLEASTRQSKGLANAEVTRCLLTTDLDPLHRSLFESLDQSSQVELPYVVVRTTIAGRAINHWHGKLQVAMDANLFESPARKELSRRLLSGDSIVWLLLKSGDEKRTNQSRELLSTSFKSLADTIALPEGVGLPGSELHSEVPLLVRFSMLEIDPADDREQLLVKLLSGLRPGAVEAGEPLIVPVFGRGRALEVIPADELDSHLIQDLTMFLSAACSCQVKEQNPGFDLLISADWDVALFGKEGVRPPPAKTTGDRVNSPVLLSIPPGRKK